MGRFAVITFAVVLVAVGNMPVSTNGSPSSSGISFDAKITSPNMKKIQDAMINAGKANTTAAPVSDETNTTAAPVSDETTTTSAPVSDETNTTAAPVSDETGKNINNVSIYNTK